MSLPTLSPAADYSGNMPPGALADQVPSQTESYTNSGATVIDMGVAVVMDVTSTSKTCKAQDGDTNQILGISGRSAMAAASTDGLNTVNYPRYASVPVIRDGVVWVKAAEAVTRGRQVLALTAGGAGNGSAGALGSTVGGAAGAGRLTVPGAVWEDTVASGAMGRVRIKSVGTVSTST
jgi:hypothetical protein